MKKLYKEILDTVIEENSHLHNRSINDRVLLIDGLNTFIRSWTTSPNMNENGEHVGGTVGFLKSIAYAIRETNPTRVIVVFDGKDGNTKRKGIYDGYKADRGKNRFRVNRTYPEMMTVEDEHESMKRQFVTLIDFLDYLPITTLIYDGIEADDVIAYISNHLVDSEIVIMSTDKDFLQLVDERVIVYSPTQKIIYNIDATERKFGLFYKNILLYRVLDGDSSDNIPGVKGCGLKTLVKRFPEIQSRMVNMDELFELSKSRESKSCKLYRTILDSEPQIRMNDELMNLRNPQIGSRQKLQILTKLEEKIPKLNNSNFITLNIKYGMDGNWNKDVHSWLRESFGGLLHG